jgi:hypothetical protein
MKNSILRKVSMAAVAAICAVSVSCLSTAAFAADSKTNAVEVVDTTDASGNSVDIEITVVDSSAVAENKPVEVAGKQILPMTQAQAESNVMQQDVISCVPPAVAAVLETIQERGDVEVKAEILTQFICDISEDAAYPLTVRFAVPGVQPGDACVIYQFQSASKSPLAKFFQPVLLAKAASVEKGTWEPLYTVAGNGYVDVTFYEEPEDTESLLSVVVYTDEDGNVLNTSTAEGGVSSSGNGGSSSGTTGDTSPKTNDINWALPAGIVAVAAVAGIVVVICTSRKRRHN